MSYTVFVQVHDGDPGDQGRDHVIPVEPVEMWFTVAIEPWHLRVLPAMSPLVFRSMPKGVELVTHCSVWVGPTMVWVAALDPAAEVEEGVELELHISWDLVGARTYARHTRARLR